MEWIKSIDPTVFKVGAMVLSVGLGVLFWYFIKGSIKKAARKEAEFEQREKAAKKNREQNEKYRENLKESLDSISDDVDPNNPWDGL